MISNQNPGEMCQSKGFSSGVGYGSYSVISFGEVHDEEHPTRITVTPTAESIRYFNLRAQGAEPDIYHRSLVEYCIDEVTRRGDGSPANVSQRPEYPKVIRFHEGALEDSFNIGLHGVLVEDLISICADHAARQFGRGDGPPAMKVDRATEALALAAQLIIEARAELNLRSDPRFKDGGGSQYHEICSACLREDYLAKDDVHFDGFRCFFTCKSCHRRMVTKPPGAWVQEMMQQKGVNQPSDRCSQIAACGE